MTDNILARKVEQLKREISKIKGEIDKTPLRIESPLIVKESRVFEVQSAATGDGVYHCMEQKLLSAEWDDIDGDNKFADLCREETSITAFSGVGGGEVQVTSTGHGFSTGKMCLITETTPNDYNGSYRVTKVDDNNFKITHDWLGDATGYVGETTGETLNLAECVFRDKTVITAVADAGDGEVRITSVDHGFSTGNTGLITEMAPHDYNGRYSITRLDDDHFKITHAWLGTSTGYVKEAGSHNLPVGALLNVWQVSDDEGNKRWIGKVIILWSVCEEE